MKQAILVAVLLASLAAHAQKPFAYVPSTVSPEWQQRLSQTTDPALNPPNPAPNDIAGWKKVHDEFENAIEPEVPKLIERAGATVTDRKIGGVPVVDIKPRGWTKSDKLLIYTHGGAYTFFSARSSLIGALSAASATGLHTISIDYTVAPNAKWDAITDQVVAVFAALQKDGVKFENIALFGDSAGGGLAAGATLKMRDRGLAMPAVVVLWSPWSDIGEIGDTYFTLRGDDPYLVYANNLKNCADAYADPKDQKNPYVSPVYGDYAKGFPPTLVQGGTKEIFVSDMVRQYQAIDTAGLTAKLDLYEGMPHVFMSDGETPEAKLALKKMRQFIEQYIGKSSTKH